MFLGVLPPGLCPAPAAAEAVEQAARAVKTYSVRLTGPNDGEPINSRLELSLLTDYLDKGNVNLEVQGVWVLTQDVLLNSFTKDGYRTVRITLDLMKISQQLGTDLLHPDAGPIRVTATVYTPGDQGAPSALVGSGSWSGIVGKPWIDFPNRIIVGADGKEQSTVPTRAIVYPLKTDILYILFAAQDRSLLTRSPDDPKLLREARVVSSGPYYSPPPGKPAGSLVYMDSMASTGWKVTYFVVWTYDSEGGWKRSAISAFSR